MKNLKKTAALILALVFIVSAFAGCNKPKEEEGPAFAYVPEYNDLKIDLGEGGWMGNVIYAGGKVYATASVATGTEKYTDPETGDSWDNTTYATKLYSMNPDGSEVKELTDFALEPATYDENGSTDSSIRKVFSAGDKTYVVKSVSTWKNNNETGEYSSDEMNYLCEIDENGKALSEKLVYENHYGSNMTEDTSSGFSARNIYASKDGTKWYLLGDEQIRVCDAELNELFTVDVTGLNDVIVLPDGRVAITSYGDTGIVYKILDEATKTFGEGKPLPSNLWSFYPGNEEYQMISTNESGIFGINIETGESTKLVDYIDSDLNPDGIYEVCALDDGNFFTYSNTYDDTTGNNKYELITLKKTDSASIPDRKLIKMAMMYMDWDTRNRIVEFNKKNTEYRITVTDYSEFNTADDYTAGITKLNTEITSGNIPDIFVASSNMPIKKYAAKGIFEDLNPYLEKDFGKDSMVEPFYKALLSDDGKLYELYSAFYVQTYYGLKKVVGDGSSWTYKDMLAAMDTLQPGASVFEPYYDRNTAINIFITSNMDSYVDWESGECYFDSEDFIGLLEATSLFPKEYKWDENQEDLNESSITRLAGGKQLLANAYMSDLNNVRAETWYQTDEELSFVGLPTNSGTGNTFGINGAGFCISSTSQYKDVCWDFIKEIYEEEYFNDHSYWGIPTNKQWYEKAFEAAMTPKFPEDGEDTADSWYSSLTVKNEAYGPAISEDGKTEVPQSSYGTQDGEFAIYAMKPEERVRMEEIINSAKTVARYDTSLTTIISEECEAFFSGQKSAADTAQMIQSRVKLYVNEQK